MNSIERNRYDPATHAIRTGGMDRSTTKLMERNQATQSSSAMQFGTPDEAIADVEQGIEQLKSGQIDLLRFATLLRAALQVIEDGQESSPQRQSLIDALASPYRAQSA